MPLASPSQIEDVTGLKAEKVEQAIARAKAAERKARRELGGKRYDEVVARPVRDPDREALVEGECLWCLYLAAPFLNLTPNEVGGFTKSTGWDESRSENMSHRELQQFRDDMREQAEGAFEEAREEGQAAEDNEPEDDEPLYHL